MEDKRQILDAFTTALKLTRAGQDIERIQLDDMEVYAYVVYKDESIKKICVACDSGMAMMLDILKYI